MAQEILAEAYQRAVTYQHRKVFAFPCELPVIDELAHTIEREYAQHRYRQ